MNVLRCTVIDSNGGVSFLTHGDALPALVAACSTNPPSIQDFFARVEPYYRTLADYVQSGLAVFDEMNTAGHYETIHRALTTVPRHKQPVFRVVDDLTREASLRPVKAGAVIFNLKAKRIVLLAWGILALCPVALALVKERPSALECTERPSWSQYIPRLSTILRQDRRFAWLAATMCLAGFADMGAVFYVLYAHERLGLPQQAIGLFISAQVVGGLLSGVALGPLGDRSGARAVIRTVMAMRFLAPLLVLATPLLAGLSPELATGSFMVVFVLTGVVGGSYMTGSMNYLLEIAPAAERATYVALANTLEGAIVLAPLAAGWIVKVGSYEPLLWLTCVLGLAGFAVCLRQPRRVPAAAAALEGRS